MIQVLRQAKLVQEEATALLAARKAREEKGKGEGVVEGTSREEGKGTQGWRIQLMICMVEEMMEKAARLPAVGLCLGLGEE